MCIRDSSTTDLHLQLVYCCVIEDEYLGQSTEAPLLHIGFVKELMIGHPLLEKYRKCFLLYQVSDHLVTAHVIDHVGKDQHEELHRGRRLYAGQSSHEESKRFFVEG